MDAERADTRSETTRDDRTTADDVAEGSSTESWRDRVEVSVDDATGSVEITVDEGTSGSVEIAVGPEGSGSVQVSIGQDATASVDEQSSAAASGGLGGKGTTDPPE